MPFRTGGQSTQTQYTCASCGEVCEQRTITFALPRSESGMAIIRNVPAEVCPLCGETQFSLQTTARLMAVVRSSDPPEEVAVIPIYDLARVR